MIRCVAIYCSSVVCGLRNIPGRYIARVVDTAGVVAGVDVHTIMPWCRCTLIFARLDLCIFVLLNLYIGSIFVRSVQMVYMYFEIPSFYHFGYCIVFSFQTDVVCTLRIYVYGYYWVTFCYLRSLLYFYHFFQCCTFCDDVRVSLLLYILDGVLCRLC